MASGFSQRFGANKLLSPFRGKPLYKWALEAIPPQMFDRVVVVTRYPEIEKDATAIGLHVVVKPQETEYVSGTIQQGLLALKEGYGGYCFMVCDQPLLQMQSVHNLAIAFQREPMHIWALGNSGKKGNPVLFPGALFPELQQLAKQETGSTLIARYPQALRILSVADERELWDVDTLKDLKNLE